MFVYRLTVILQNVPWKKTELEPVHADHFFLAPCYRVKIGLDRVETRITAIWREIWLANLQPVFLYMYFLYCLHMIAFYLFSFTNGVLPACQPRLILSLRFFLSFFFCPWFFFSSQSRRRKRAPVTLQPQSHLRQMKQPLSFCLLAPFSPLLFHPPTSFF